MAAKKDRGRFNIRLNENDPAHEAVIRLLEKQPSHGKAQLVVDALLQYMRGPAAAAPAESAPHAMSRDEIEAIVLDVLRRQNADRQVGSEAQAMHPGEANAARAPRPAAGEEFNVKTPENQAALALIADTLSAFRGG